VRARAARLALLAALVTLAACTSPSYLLRAGWSEARLLLRRQPIAELLARPDLDPGLRERLELTLAVREFAASSLGLRVGKSYSTFAEVGDDATVWVVSAAHRDRLEPFVWRYPLVGRLPYRGFFERADADALAARLSADDLDVDVRSALAFSTLGWFADPLLSNVADEPPVEVATTVLHELFHATLYLPGQAAFNESAATFAGQRGAIAFFCGGPGDHPERCTDAGRRWVATRARGRVLTRVATRLRRLYASAPAAAARERARGRLLTVASAVLTRRGLGGRRDLLPPNNARLLGELLYVTELEALDALVPTGGDLGAGLARLVAVARSAPDPFEAVRALATSASGR
jgi:predicted aminopeptidase